MKEKEEKHTGRGAGPCKGTAAGRGEGREAGHGSSTDR